MRLKFPIFSAAVAVLSGLIVLFFYFFPPLGAFDWRATLLQWAASLTAVALLVGVLNLASVHLGKLNDEGANPLYSGVLLIALVVTFLLVLVMGPVSETGQWVFNYIQLPIETSLMAVLAVSLAYASARMLRRRPTVFTLLFIGTVLIVLLGYSPLATAQLPLISELLVSLQAWVAQVPALAGARGILLGVALGTIATGLRILMAADRPYGG